MKYQNKRLRDYPMNTTAIIALIISNVVFVLISAFLFLKIEDSKLFLKKNSTELQTQNLEIRKEWDRMAGTINERIVENDKRFNQLQELLMKKEFKEIEHLKRDLTITLDNYLELMGFQIEFMNSLERFNNWRENHIHKLIDINNDLIDDISIF
jgi:hypothetical protein